MLRVTGKGLAIGLVISLAANLFLGGMLVARFLFDPGHRIQRHRGPINFRAGMQTLDDKSRARVVIVWRSHRSKVRASVREMRRSRRQLARRLMDGNADNVAVEKAFAEVRTRAAAAQVETSKLLREISLSMTAAQRKLFFRAAFKRRRDRWRRRDRIRRGPPPGWRRGPPPGRRPPDQ